MVKSTITPTVEMLKEVRLFQKFSENELERLTQIGECVMYEPHANIVIEGELSWGLYLVLDGWVGVYKTNKLGGNTYDLGQLKNGSFFGEMSLIDENPRSATVRALTTTHLYTLSKETFNQYLSQYPDLKLRFYENCVRDLVHRLRELDENYVVSQYQLWKTAIRKEAA